MDAEQRRPSQRYDQPFDWWGFGEPPPPRSIVELIDQGVLDARVAAFLWLALERHASVVVAAEPQGAGKTTLLTALLDFLPAQTMPIYLRGWYERFDFLATADPEHTYLLCNEISSHLPTYLWGRGVRRLFEAMSGGYSMATTMHASTADAVLALLSAFPLEVPPRLLCGIDLVLTLAVGKAPSGQVRRLMRLERIDERDGMPVPVPLATRQGVLGELVARPGELVAVLTRHFGYDLPTATAEMARRERFLERLRRVSIHDVDAVRASIAAFNDGGHPPAWSRGRGQSRLT